MNKQALHVVWGYDLGYCNVRCHLTVTVRKTDFTQTLLAASS